MDTKYIIALTKNTFGLMQALIESDFGFVHIMPSVLVDNRKLKKQLNAAYSEHSLNKLIQIHSSVNNLGLMASQGNLEVNNYLRSNMITAKDMMGTLAAFEKLPDELPSLQIEMKTDYENHKKYTNLILNEMTEMMDILKIYDDVEESRQRGEYITAEDFLRELQG